MDNSPAAIAAERQRINAWRARHPARNPTLEECRERMAGSHYAHRADMGRLLFDMSLPLVDAVEALGRRGVGGRFLEDMA